MRRWPELAIVLLAAGLRFWNIDFHLPLLTHPDEPVYVHNGLVSAARGMEVRRHHIGNAVPTLTAAWAGTLYAAGRATGRWASTSDFLESHVADPTAVFLGVRVANALASVALVAALLALGPALVGSRAAALAALFLAVNADDVREAHFLAGHDLAALCATAALLLVLDPARSGASRAWLASGALIGLAGAAKTHALYVLPAALVALAWQPPGAPRRRLLALFSLGLFAGHALGVPGMLRAPLAYVAGHLADLGDTTSGGYLDTGAMPRIGFYALHHAPGGFGWPLWALCVAGWIAFLVRGERGRLLLALSPALLFLALHNGPGLARYALPAYPMFCLAGGALADALIGSRRVLAAVAIPLLVYTPLARSVRYDLLLGAPDTRALAKAWIEAHVPAGARIANEGMEIDRNVSRVGVPLVKMPAEFARQRAEARREGHGGALLAALEADARRRTTYEVHNVVRIDEPSALAPACDGPGCLDAYRRAGVEWLVTVDWIPRRALRGRRYAPDFEDALARGFTPVQRFAARPPMPYCTMTWLISYPALDSISFTDRDLVHGPEVVIWRRRD